MTRFAQISSSRPSGSSRTTNAEEGGRDDLFADLPASMSELGQGKGTSNCRPSWEQCPPDNRPEMDTFMNIYTEPTGSRSLTSRRTIIDFMNLALLCAEMKGSVGCLETLMNIGV